jgi:hypothetical protein
MRDVTMTNPATVGEGSVVAPRELRVVRWCPFPIPIGVCTFSFGDSRRNTCVVQAFIGSEIIDVQVT